MSCCSGGKLSRVSPSAGAAALESAAAPRGRPMGKTAGLCAVLLAAALVRLWFAFHKGLVLDEFHTLFHASAANAASFFDGLRRDNHPPLSFLLVAAFRSALGDDEWALRLPALLFGLAEIALVWRIARRLGGAWAPLLAAALLSASSLHLDFSTQARMYALHSLAVTALTATTLAVLEARAPRRLRLAQAAWAACVVAGAHDHYFFLYYAALLGAGILAARVLGAVPRDRWRRFLVPAAVAALLCLPWYAWGFWPQLQHGLNPGGRDVGLAALGEALVHLFFLNVRIAGPELRLVFIAAGVALLGYAAYGLWRALPLGRRQERALPVPPPLPLLLGAVGFGVPAAATLVAALFPRAGFTWHYVLPSAPALALLAAAGFEGEIRPRLHRAGLAAILGAATLLALLNAGSRGTEDYPGAVRSILADFEPGDAVISVECQPAHFAQGLPWDYYAPRLAAPEGAPPRLAMDGAFHLARPAELARYGRVHVLCTSMPDDWPLMRLLYRGYDLREQENFGYGVDALLFVER